MSRVIRSYSVAFKKIGLYDYVCIFAEIGFFQGPMRMQNLGRGFPESVHFYFIHLDTGILQ